MEKARELDLQDRFLNAKSGKYWIRAGEQERAERTAGLFTKVRLELSPPSFLPSLPPLLF